jgi:hypothetical protein
MAYAIRARGTGYGMLVEMNARDMKLVAADKHPDQAQGIEYYECTTQRAHQWVRDGGTHSTSLWVDQGRIRRAQSDTLSA